MHRITKRWDRQDTFAFTFGAVCLLIAITIAADLSIAALFTAVALAGSFALWLRA